jgi:hypothetical protein
MDTTPPSGGGSAGSIPAEGNNSNYMEKESRDLYEQDETANARRGIDLVKEIAARHEQELKKMIKDRGGNILEPINEGPVTTEKIVKEFEELAGERGVDLNDFYKVAGRLTFTGRSFEQTTFIQIIFAYHRREK